MDILIVTGMSGAGKSKCLKILEDMGYLCMDNILPQLIKSVVETCERNKESMSVEKLAISVDVRGGIFFSGIFDALLNLRESGQVFRVLYLDATDEVLLNRYKESRREHPLAVGSRVINGIVKEREILVKLRDQADCYIDTSHLSVKDLKQKIFDLLPRRRGDGEPSSVVLVTFGLKRGIPMDCDVVWDLRFLRNPFHEEELRPDNGLKKEVADYVFADPVAEPFVQSVVSQIEMILPAYVSNVKPSIVIGIGCTGGRHRSVAVAERLRAELEKKGIPVSVEHRDLFKE